MVHGRDGGLTPMITGGQRAKIYHCRIWLAVKKLCCPLLLLTTSFQVEDSGQSMWSQFPKRLELYRAYDESDHPSPSRSINPQLRDLGRSSASLALANETPNFTTIPVYGPGELSNSLCSDSVHLGILTEGRAGTANRGYRRSDNVDIMASLGRVKILMQCKSRGSLPCTGREGIVTLCQIMNK